jgi:hypothetical protein
MKKQLEGNTNLSIGFKRKLDELQPLNPYIKLEAQKRKWEKLSKEERKAWEDYMNQSDSFEDNIKAYMDRIKTELTPLIRSIHDSMALMNFLD